MRKSLNFLWAVVFSFALTCVQVVLQENENYALNLMLGIPKFLLKVESWSIHDPGECSMESGCWGGAEFQLCSKSQPVAYMARTHGRTLLLPNNLSFCISVSSSLKRKVQSS